MKIAMEQIDFIKDKNYRQLLLIRHAEPDVMTRTVYNYREALAYTKAYDKNGVRKIEKVYNTSGIEESVCIYSSDLPRAFLTAKALFGDRAVTSNPIFREFNSQLIRLPGRHPITFWLRTGRFFWFLGYRKKGYESRSSAFKRLKRAVDFIDRESGENKTIIVSHALFIYFLKEELKKKGWMIKRDDGSHFLSVKLLIKNGI